MWKDEGEAEKFVLLIFFFGVALIVSKCGV